MCVSVCVCTCAVGRSVNGCKGKWEVRSFSTFSDAPVLYHLVFFYPVRRVFSSQPSLNACRQLNCQTPFRSSRGKRMATLYDAGKAEAAVSDDWVFLPASCTGWRVSESLPSPPPFLLFPVAQGRRVSEIPVAVYHDYEDQETSLHPFLAHWLHGVPSRLILPFPDSLYTLIQPARSLSGKGRFTCFASCPLPPYLLLLLTVFTWPAAKPVASWFR